MGSKRGSGLAPVVTVLHPAWAWPAFLLLIIGAASLLWGPWGLEWLGVAVLLVPVAATMALALGHYRNERRRKA